MVWVREINVRGPQGPSGGIDPNDPVMLDSVRQAIEDEIQAQRLVKFGDPAIPEQDQWPDNSRYLFRELDRLGRMSRGVRRVDGANEMAKADVQELQLNGTADRLTAAGPGTGRAFGIVDTDGRLSELVVTEQGIVPSWVLTRWAGRMGWDSASSTSGWDVIDCSGQSNMTDREDPAGVAVVNPNIWAWVDGAAVPLPADDTSPAAWAAREYAMTGQAAGRRILVVNTSLGSTGFTSSSLAEPPEGYSANAPGTWDRTLTADPVNLALRARNNLSAALAFAGPTARVVAFVWSQGEQDGTRMTKAEYAAALDDYLEWRREQAGVLDAPLLVGGTNPDWYPDDARRIAIAEALAETPRRLERAGFFWGPAGMSQWDQPIHWSWQGSRVRGRGFIREALLEAQANRDGSRPVAPAAAVLSRNGDVVTVSWSRPECRVVTIVVEYSTDGATWQDMTFDAAHGSRATATVPASTAVQARIAVINSAAQSAYQLVS